MLGRTAARSARVTALYRGVRDFIRGPAVVASRPGLIPELIPIDAMGSAVQEPRLNLVMGSLDMDTMYGGAPTALRLYLEVIGHANTRSRIVSLDRLPAKLPDLEGHRQTEPLDETAQRSAVGPDATGQITLPVGARDVFVATFWTTADAVMRLRHWQAQHYGQAPRYFVYVIQDHEPSFYPLSTQQVLADQTYGNPEQTIGVFNSGQLADYFHEQGHMFAHEFAFEPRLPDELRSRERPLHRERILLVYGRPSKPRNAFPLVVEALRQWHRSDPDARTWTCLSAGEAHAAIDLGGSKLESLGKLTMQEYGDLLGRSAVGLYIGLGPGSVYVPTEMAHFGLLVLTNRGTVTDRETLHENITTLPSLSPSVIADSLSAVCAGFVSDPSIGMQGRLKRMDYLARDSQFPFAEELTRLLELGIERGERPEGPPR